MPELSIPELIAKKRDGESLTFEEIHRLIKGVTSGDVQDVQIGAMLMAMYLKGLNFTETAHLTKAMLHSGKRFHWPESFRGLVVDKHSTGGVGDKVSLILAPALAACGMKVPMISGRSLGFTGGTIDKLESIPGYSPYLTTEQALHAMEEVNCFIMAQTENIVPADRILYAARDVTSTVDSVPLITASILSKKAAEDIDALVLDVKCGRGAFCRDYESAKTLSDTMVKVGSNLGIRTAVTITKMDNPLGRMIGNALEVKESIQLLKGSGPEDLKELVEVQGAVLLTLTSAAVDMQEGRQMIADSLTNGSALSKFHDMLIVQGVDRVIANELCYGKLDTILQNSARTAQIFHDGPPGFISSIDALELAKVSGELGANRTKAGERIDHSVGLELLLQVGCRIVPGQPWINVHHGKEPLSEAHKKRLITSLTVSVSQSESEPQTLLPFTNIIEVIKA